VSVWVGVGGGERAGLVAYASLSEAPSEPLFVCVKKKTSDVVHFLLVSTRARVLDLSEGERARSPFSSC
jgi:hypothetical protein